MTTLKARFLHWARTLSHAKLALMAWILDVCSCLYFPQWWQARNSSDNFMRLSLKANGLSYEEATPEFIAEFTGMIDLTISGMLLALIITNTIFYLGYARQKKWSVGYVRAFVMSAAVLSPLMLLEGFVVGGIWEVINVLVTLSYPVLAVVVYLQKKAAATSPGAGSPGR